MLCFFGEKVKSRGEPLTRNLAKRAIDKSIISTLRETIEGSPEPANPMALSEIVALNEMSLLFRLHE